MFSNYVLFKFIHVVSAIIWIGGAVSLTWINVRLSRSQDMAAQAALARVGEVLGGSFFGPAALATLAAGIATAVIGGMSFGATWITWGFLGIFISILLGAVLMRRISAQIGRLAAQGATHAPQIASLKQRLSLINALNVLVLLSVVWAMVAKPSF